MSKNDPSMAAAIHQFLIKNGFLTSAEAFQEECLDKNINWKEKDPKLAPKFNEIGDYKKKLLTAFEKVDKSRFFSLFHEIFGNSRLELSLTILEFECHIYFATSPLRKNPPDRQEFRKSMDDLKIYLENGHGANMSKMPELLPFFALPYVTDPMKHPVFIELLSKKYARQLHQRLWQQLKKTERSDSVSSDSDEDLQIFNWKHAYDSRKLLSTVDKARIKDYQDLQHDYYKIIDIAGELIECLEQTCHGKTISPDLFSNIANRLIESNQEAERRMQKSAMILNKRTPPTMPISKRNRSLTRRIPENVPRKRPEPVKKSESSGNLIPADPKSLSPPEQRSKETKIQVPFADLYIQLNFTKISNQLVKNPGTRSSALLIQALRLQITKKPQLADAIPVLEIFAEKDVFLLKNRKNSVVATIVALTEQNVDTKEELARLLNAVSSFKRGRDYLLAIAQGKELLYQLALALRTKKLANQASDHTLAALEKLSVRANVQKELVLSGMIEWLIQYLESATVGNFGLEYGTALMANLCMNSVSQSTIFRYKDRLLDLLKKLVVHANFQLIPSAANTLYVLFGYAKMRSTAKEMDFEGLISERLKTIDSAELEAQLNVVLKILQGELEVTKRKETDDDEEDDYVEAEVDSTDSLIPAMTELFGEVLLQKKYSLAGQQATLPATVEDVAPPGTVPRRHVMNPRQTGARPAIKPYMKRNAAAAVNTTYRRGGRDQHVPREPVPVPPESPDLRMSSMASFATFVAENDQRKPLIGPTGLKAAVTQWKQSQKKLLPKVKEVKESVVPLEEPHKSPKKETTRMAEHSTNTRYRVRRKSDSSIAEESYLDVPVHAPLKATSSMTLSSDAAPVVGKVNSRIPDDANVNEYVAVFGSRPKVVRTPDHTGHGGKPKPTVFTY